MIGIETTAMEFCSLGERLGSIPNTTWASRNLRLRIRVGVGGCNISLKGKFWLN